MELPPSRVRISVTDSGRDPQLITFGLFLSFFSAFFWPNLTQNPITQRGRSKLTHTRTHTRHLKSNFHNKHEGEKIKKEEQDDDDDD